MAGTIEFITFGYTYLYENTLNNIAIIFKHDLMRHFIKGGQIFGALCLIFQITKQHRINPLLQWILTLLITATIFFSGNVTVIIKDLTQDGASESTSVDHIPYGLSLIMYLSNRIGAGLTYLFDASLHQTDDHRYTETGFLMNQKLVASLRQYEISDPRLRDNLESYIKECVFYDLLLGQYSIESLVNETALMHFLKSHAAKNRGLTYQDQNKTTSILTCHEAITKIDTELQSKLNVTLAHFAEQIFGLSQRLSDTVLIQKIKDQLPSAFQYLSNSNQSNAERLVTQALLSNGIMSSLASFAAETNSNAALTQAMTYEKIKKDKNATHNLMAAIGRDYLPMLRPLFECTLYYLYILIALFMLFPIGMSILGFYLRLLLWIQLWSPLYAIFDSLFVFLSQQATQARLAGLKGLAISNHLAIADLNQDLASIAGYLSFSATAYMSFYLVTRSEQLAPYIAGLLTHDPIDPAISHAHEIATNNSMTSKAPLAQHELFHSLSNEHSPDLSSDHTEQSTAQSQHKAATHITEENQPHQNKLSAKLKLGLDKIPLLNRIPLIRNLEGEVSFDINTSKPQQGDHS